MKSSRTLTLHVQYAPILRAEALPQRAQVRRWVKSTLTVLARTHTVTPCELTVRFCGAREGRELNRDFRQRDYATNVLTFPLNERSGPGVPVAADLVVCVPVVAKQARQQGKTFIAHCAHMIVHATLHAHGLDHERRAEAEVMENIEIVTLKRFHIANPYL
jgi:probable rRNA maturation factor